MGAPAGLEFKTAGAVTAPQVPAALAGPNAKPKGYVKAIVAVTGIKDDVDDVIVPGAFKRTLAERLPKVCLGHDWNRPIGRTLSIKELMPGDSELPATTQAGDPWPKEAGAVISEALYNLGTQDGRDAYAQAMFYKDTGECYQSIGYRVTPDGKSFKAGKRYILDLDLFEYGPVLHPANRLAGVQDVKGDDGPLENNAVQPGESKTRYVKDSSFWGLPVGTPITPGMKPRGRTALAERRKGQTPDRAAGTTTEPPKPTANGKAPRAVAHKPEKAKAERDAAGLFPEPDAPEGARVKPSDPQGFDHLHVADIIENEAGKQDPVDRDHAIIGLIDEGITPAELEEDLRASEDWPDDMSDEDKEASIQDVVADYRNSYRREAARQAANPNTEQHPDDANLEHEQELADNGGVEKTPEPDKRDITTLTDDELATYRETARKGALTSLNGSDKQKQFQDIIRTVDAEKARREDAARRTVTAHPLDPKAYGQAQLVAGARRQRAEDVARRNTVIDKGNAEITASEEAAANAPDVMKKLPPKLSGQSVSKATNGRVGFRGKGTANWAIVSSDGRAIVTPLSFESGGRANVKLSGSQLDQLADRIAGITNSKGDKAPFTDPNSEGWVPGFRDSDGRSLDQAVSRVVDDWATANNLTTSSRIKSNLANQPFGHAQGPAGVVDAEGFHPQERIQDVGIGDQVKLRDGTVKTIKAVEEDTGSQRDRYDVGVFTLTFDDDTTGKFSVGQRFDTKYAEDRNPDQEGYLNEPGMGYTSNSALGDRTADPVTHMDNPNAVAAGTRIMYTPDRPGGDNRPRVGTVTDKYTTVNGRTFQVVEYDDGTFDGVNVGKLIADGKIQKDPTPEQEADTRAQWGLDAGDGATEPGPDLAEGEPGDGELGASDNSTGTGSDLNSGTENAGESEGAAPARPKVGDQLDIEAALPNGVDDVADAPWYRFGQTLKFDDKPIEELPISSLLRTQDTANTLGDKTVEAYTGDEPVKVVRYQGKDWLFDGHHRVIGALAAGRDTIPAQVLDMDNPNGGTQANGGPGGEVNPDRTPIAGLANQLTGQAKPDVTGISTGELGELDQEFSRRAQLLGKPDAVIRAHQAVRDELATRTDTGAEGAIEPDGGLGADEAVISREEIDQAQGAADEILGITEGPDGELEAEPDVADRQDRVETLLDQAESGSLDLTKATDDEVTGQRRDLVDELRFQDAVARRDRRTRQQEQSEETAARDGAAATGGEGDGAATDGGTGGDQPVEPAPKLRPGVAGAAEDLADALEGGQDSTAAVARLESSIRRSRSDSAHLDPLRAAVQADGGLQAAIDAGDVTPATLREFAQNLRDERRQQGNEKARDRRTVKRLERERLRGLITQYDTELRRRNLNPEKFGGAVPPPDDGTGAEVSGGASDGGDAEAIAPDVNEETSVGPGADRAQLLRAEPWRFVNSNDATMNGSDATSTSLRQAASAAFADLAQKYAPVLDSATPDEIAAVEARLAKRADIAASGVRSEAMVIALILPKGEMRDAFMSDSRNAMDAYRANVAALTARAERGEVNLDPAPKLASVAPGRIGWGGRLNALAARPRADRPAGTPPFTTVAAVKSHLKGLEAPPGASPFDQSRFAEGRDRLVQAIDGAGADVYLSPGGGLLAFRGDTRDGKRWFLIHTQTGQSIPTMFNFGKTSNDLGPSVVRGQERGRYDLDGPAMRRMMTALETTQDPQGRTVDFTAPDGETLVHGLLGWRDFSADGSVRPAVVEGQFRYDDSLEAAATFEAVRDDLKRYATTSAVHRATQGIWGRTTYTGVNGRSPQQVRQLINEQFPFALQDYNYGRKRVRGLGPTEDRTAAQLKDDKVTATAIDQANTLVLTGNPAEAVAVLRARAGEMKATDAERGPRFGSRRLDTLADQVADLYSPAQAEMDRLINAKAGDSIAVNSGPDSEEPSVFRLVSDPTLVITRPDGTRSYRMTVTSEKMGDQSATIDTSDQYGVRIGDRFDTRDQTLLSQSGVNQWSVYRAQDEQVAPTSNAEVITDSQRSIREFNRAAGFGDGEDGPDGGGGGGPDSGPSGGPDTGGERSVAAEGKAITVADARQGDFVAIPSGTDAPPFLGHVLKIDTRDNASGLSVVDSSGNVRALPLDRSGVIHRIDMTDQQVLDQLPDFDQVTMMDAGAVADGVLDLLPEGTPVRIVTGTLYGNDYTTVATGIVAIGPRGAFVRTGDGRMLTAAGLGEGGDYPRVETVHDVGDVTGPDDKYVDGKARPVDVVPGSRVQAFVSIEDPAVDGGARSAWVNGWIEHVERAPDSGTVRQVLVRTPSGSVITVRTTGPTRGALSGRGAAPDVGFGYSNKLRVKGKPTKATLASVNAANASYTTRQDSPAQLAMGVNAVHVQAAVLAHDTALGDNPFVDNGLAAAERLRKVADAIEAEQPDVSAIRVSLGHNDVLVRNELVEYFGGLPSGSTTGETAPPEAKAAAAAFAQAYTVRLLRDVAASVAEFDAIEDQDSARHEARLTSAVKLTVGDKQRRVLAMEKVAVAHAEAIAKVSAVDAEDPDTSIPAAQRRTIDAAISRAYGDAHGRLVIRVKEGDYDSLDAKKVRVLAELSAEGLGDRLAPVDDLGDDAKVAVTRSILDAVAGDVLALHEGGKLDSEFARVMAARAKGGEQLATPPKSVAGVVDAEIVRSRALAGLDATAPYAQRVAVLRERLGRHGVGTRATTGYRLDGDVLDGTLSLSQYEIAVTDVDPDDGGPGRTALKHSAVLKAMGEEIRAESRRLLTERKAGDPDHRRLDELIKLTDAQEKLDNDRNAIIEATLRRLAAEDRVDLPDGRFSLLRIGILRGDSTVRKSVAKMDGGPAMVRLLDLAKKEHKADLAAWEAEAKSRDDHWTERASLMMRTRDNEARWLAESRRTALKAVRELGAKGDMKVGHGGLSTLSPEAVDTYASWAGQHYPKEWIEQAKTGDLSVTQLAPRGFYDGPNSRIELSSAYGGATKKPGGAYGQVFIHEMGHHMEAKISGITRAEWIYHHERTSTGPVGSRVRETLKWMGDVMPGGGYTKNELAMPDEFVHAYSGKVYEDKPDATAWELFTMGMESLFAGSTYLDDDYENWMLGVLAGV